jgi:hypothetical protein
VQVTQAVALPVWHLAAGLVVMLQVLQSPPQHGHPGLARTNLPFLTTSLPFFFRKPITDNPLAA